MFIDRVTESLSHCDGQGWIIKTNQAEFFFVPVKAGEGQGTRIVVDQESGGGEGGGGEARKLLVSCSFNCLDWTCGQPSG